MGKPSFQEKAKTISIDSDLLRRRINELALRLQGTRLEELIQRLYQELETRGIAFKPRCYLADGWGCPHNVPVIGIPFYLATPELMRLESELTGLWVENEADILMYLRHEAGHAFNYAYRLYDEEEWRALFGPYSRPYHDDYKPNPFSDHFVRHIPGWYAQKHPDEDFAETFAVWLTPGSNWREIYAETPAMEKLLYVERVVERVGRQSPVVTVQTLDAPVEELQETLAEYYGIGTERCAPKLPRLINADLRTLFTTQDGKPAAEVLREVRGRLVRNVNYWTGVDICVLKAIVDELLDRTDSLGLCIEPGREESVIGEMGVMLTTLAMNYRYTGEFVKQ